MSQRRAAPLAEVRNNRKISDAKTLRGEMYRRIGDAVRDAGDRISGYAVVIWDTDGFSWSTLKSGNPIKSRIMPSFVHDAIQQHVTLDLAAEDRRK